MSTSIRVSDETEEKLERIKLADESSDDLPSQPAALEDTMRTLPVRGAAPTRPKASSRHERSSAGASAFDDVPR